MTSLKNRKIDKSKSGWLYWNDCQFGFVKAKWIYFIIFPIWIMARNYNKLARKFVIKKTFKGGWSGAFFVIKSYPLILQGWSYKKWDWAMFHVYIQRKHD